MKLKVIGAAALALGVAASAAPAQAATWHWGISNHGWHAGPFGVHVRHPFPNVGFDVSVDGPRWRWTSGHRDRCEDRYRSYNRLTDTFLGNDGKRHFCRL